MSPLSTYNFTFDKSGKIYTFCPFENGFRARWHFLHYWFITYLHAESRGCAIVCVCVCF